MKLLLNLVCLIAGFVLHDKPRLVHAEGPIRAGDRVAIVGNTFADQLRIHGYLETLLLQHWPDNRVSVRHLGWAGDMLSARDRPTGFPSEESELLAYRTDAIVACFGMGESFAGEAGLDDFQSDLRSFIQTHTGKSYNGLAAVRLVIVSPIAYEELGELTPAYQRRNQELARYTRAMSDVTAAQQVPLVNLYQPSRYLMDESIGPNFTTNGIHLNAFGYWALSHYLFRGLVGLEQGASPPPWRVAIDALTNTATAHGVDVAELTHLEQGISFRVREITGPTLAPPTVEPLPPQLNIQRDALMVSNLKPGSYRLTVDGEPVVTARHDAWSEGVAIDASPAHREAEALRQAVNDKNLQFTYSWKALNQVHIVGERKTSPSGQALPGEVIEFKRMADQREEQLRDMLQLRSRQWRLERVAD